LEHHNIHQQSIEVGLMKATKLYKKAWKKYGHKHQLDILIEEMSELTKSILKARRSKKTYTKKVFEELADVRICTDQLRWYLKGKGMYKKVKKQKIYKLKRLKKILRD
jgi:NTP pyrophosphatase (non-canonical NTP hydrolase)